MKLDALEMRWVRMEMVETFTTSFGPTRVRDILLVRACTDGAVGWGEAGADREPLYCTRPPLPAGTSRGVRRPACSRTPVAGREHRAGDGGGVC